KGLYLLEEYGPDLLGARENRRGPDIHGRSTGPTLCQLAASGSWMADRSGPRIKDPVWQAHAWHARLTTSWLDEPAKSRERSGPRVEGYWHRPRGCHNRALRKRALG